MALNLNLGCGYRHRDGYINVDLADPCDRIVDLSRFPWPWGDGTVDSVLTHNMLEHFPDPSPVMREAWRVLKVGGLIEVVVPHYRNPQTVCCFHKTNWSIHSFTQWTDEPEHGCGEVLFRTVSCRHVYPFMRARRVLEAVANVKPLAWDWMGLPCDSVQWIGVKR
jgi:SAM-dependent methyltransferase